MAFLLGIWHSFVAEQQIVRNLFVQIVEYSTSQTIIIIIFYFLNKPLIQSKNIESKNENYFFVHHGTMKRG